ncbi:MAG: C-terminal binding protein [Myxococcales bacterium]|nr:C-terminal binding protein [Myxococcales bacterium]
MSRWTVIVPDRLAPPADVEQAVFGDDAEVITLQAKHNAELEGCIEGANAILAWHDLQWTEAVLRTMPECRVLVRVGVGYDNVDLDAAEKLGITVCNVPDYGTHDVADHAIALLLALARGLVGHDRCARTDHWQWGLVDTFRLTGRRLGIVGLGCIGTATALRAKAFGLDVSFYDPYLPEGWDKTYQLRRHRSLTDLAADSEIVSLHVPLTPQTRGMVDASFFDAASDGLVLINTARGPVVDWPAFRAAFDSGRVRCAGLDVLPDEPLDRTDPLLARWVAEEPSVRERLLITPHCAFYSQSALHEMRRKAAEEALRVLRGDPPLTRVGGAS